jgi:hypothetical protein
VPEKFLFVIPFIILINAALNGINRKLLALATNYPRNDS